MRDARVIDVMLQEYAHQQFDFIDLCSGWSDDPSDQFGIVAVPIDWFDNP